MTAASAVRTCSEGSRASSWGAMSHGKGGGGQTEKEGKRKKERKEGEMIEKGTMSESSSDGVVYIETDPLIPGSDTPHRQMHGDTHACMHREAGEDVAGHGDGPSGRRQGAAEGKDFARGHGPHLGLAVAKQRNKHGHKVHMPRIRGNDLRELRR
jgi:hypothetical protein